MRGIGGGRPTKAPSGVKTSPFRVQFPSGGGGDLGNGQLTSNLAVRKARPLDVDDGQRAKAIREVRRCRSDALPGEPWRPTRRASNTSSEPRQARLVVADLAAVSVAVPGLGERPVQRKAAFCEPGRSECTIVRRFSSTPGKE